MIILKLSFQIFAELESIVDKLATESQRGSYTLKKSNSKYFRTKNIKNILKLQKFPVNISKDQSHQELPIKMNHTMENSYQNQSQIHLTNGTANKPSSRKYLWNKCSFFRTKFRNFD